jgi:hypothetical protein
LPIWENESWDKKDSGAFFLDISMMVTDGKFFVFEKGGKGFSDGHRAMMATGATDCDAEYLFSALLVGGREKADDPVQMVQTVAARLIPQDIVRDGGFKPGKRAQGVDVVGVGKKTDIKEQIHILRCPVFVAKGENGDG